MLVVLGSILLLSAFVASVVLCGGVRALTLRLGFVDRPGARKIHDEPVALGGGVGLLLTTVGLVAAGLLFALAQDQAGMIPWLPAVLKKHIPLIVDRAGLAFYVLAGGMVVGLLGLIDDIRQLSPWTRLAVQAFVAVALCHLSREIRVTAFVRYHALSWIYTVLWIVGITNAFNLLDNMDGLSAGVAVVASVMFLVIAVMTQQYFLAAMLLVFAGALLGFLAYNFPPASLFMGDAGSMFVGYWLSVLTVLFTFYMPGRGYDPVSAMLVPLVILAVPIYDTVSVVVIRLAAGRSVFSGDRNHFSHRLVALGMSRPAAVWTIYLVTLCTGVLAPLLLKLETPLALLVFANVAGMLLIVWLLEHIGRRNRGSGIR
jgi:UDP-GlcNAc:undecaprenyl-phosphate GlcNAc-1-phosphate transferase